MGKKKHYPSNLHRPEALPEPELNKEQWDELMLACIRKLNSEGTRVVKFRLCQTMNLMAKKTLSLEGDLKVPITESLLLKNLSRAVSEEILTRQRNGSIISYGIAGEKGGRIDLTLPDPLEDGKILASIVGSLLVVRKNEGKPRGFLITEIMKIFSEGNDILYPDGLEEDKESVLENVIGSCLQKGKTTGHFRQIGKEYYVTGVRAGKKSSSAGDPFSTVV